MTKKTWLAIVGFALAALVVVARADLQRVAVSQLTSTATGTQNDVATIGYDVVRWNGASAVTFTGFNGAQAGRILIVDNVTSAQTMSFSDATGSTASYQLNTPSAVSLVCPAKSRAWLRYDSTLTKWIVSGGTGCYSEVTNLDGQLQIAASNGEQTSSATGSQSDFTINSGVSVLRWNGASNVTFSGFTGGVNGRVLYIVNESTKSISFSHSTGSSAANQLILPGATTQVLNGIGTGAILRYDSTNTKWRVLSVNTSQFNSTVTATGNASVNGNLTAGDANTDKAVVWGHAQVEGTSPTPSTCGTGPSITGSDTAGYFTTGTGGTTCTLTFSRTYTVEPSCVLFTTGSATPPTCTNSATAITCTTTVASTKYKYICIGMTGGT